MAKTGNPERMRKRDQIPRRTASRPRPYKRTPARHLWRMAFGLPSRTGRKGKIARPTAAQRRRARRTLRLRTLARGWALRKLPARLANWHWDRIWSRIPKPINPDWLKPTIPDKPPTPPPPPAGPGLATVIPLRKDPVMSNPTEVIADAFNQLAMFQPETAGEWNQFLAGQQEMWAGIAQSYATLADNARTGMAYDQAVASRLDDLAAAVSAVGDIGADAHQAFGHDG